jgi:hypothetical protein
MLPTPVRGATTATTEEDINGQAAAAFLSDEGGPSAGRSNGSKQAASAIQGRLSGPIGSRRNPDGTGTRERGDAK